MPGEAEDEGRRPTRWGAFLVNCCAYCGAVLWGGGVTLLGYLLGDKVPWVKDNLDIIFIAIVLVSVIPIAIEVIRGVIAKRQSGEYGTDVVEEFIEEHEPEEERRTP